MNSPNNSKKTYPDPNGWETEVNQWGGVRRFRRTIYGKEYEKEIIIDGIPVPESQLEEFNRRRKEAAEERIKKQNKALQEPATQCPFLCGRGGMNTKCRRECVFYCENGCAFAVTRHKPQRDTADQYCPLSGCICNRNCTMYANGCNLLELIKTIK